MKAIHGPLVVLALTLVVAGCDTPPAPSTAKIKASLEKLSPDDRKLAEEQKFCALENENRLGAMGVPYKVTIEGEAVFLCCKGCEKEVQAHPEQTLAKVKELRAKSAGGGE
jgi:hypothetical protein